MITPRSSILQKLYRSTLDDRLYRSLASYRSLVSSSSSHGKRVPTTSREGEKGPDRRNGAANGENTHFGFRQVPLSDKQNLVSSVFSSVASNYDLMNDLMSVRVHRVWKDAFVSDMAPSPGMKILDCAGGTGDIAFRISDYVRHHSRSQRTTSSSSVDVTVCDINEEMLAVGRKRATSSVPSSSSSGQAQPNIQFIHGDAQQLPFEDSTFDLYTISFGMRNVPQPEVALSEALRVLKPGGRFMMLEFAKVNSMLVSQAYDLWSFRVIPAIGRYVAQDEPAYRYLVESIRQFPGQSEFVDMMRNAGFSDATVTDYSFGIAACYSAFKPMSY